MTQAAFERGDWQAVIEAHPLESHDPAEWLRYGTALLQTIEPGPDQGKQQQQAALAFEQAKREGAPQEAVNQALKQSVLLSLGQVITKDLAGIEITDALMKKSKESAAKSRFHLHIASNEWLKAVSEIDNQDFHPDEKENLLEQLRQSILKAFAGINSPSPPNNYADVNQARESQSIVKCDCYEEAFEITARLQPATPLILINDFSSAQKQLAKQPFWIAYGNVRTGSTMIFNLLRIIANSLSAGALSAWEGDLASPEKFFEMVNEASSINLGVLKIHRSHDSVNSRLCSGEAIAIMSHRDMESSCYSYWRMLNNPRSPIYNDNPSISLLDGYVESQINAFEEKKSLPNTLIVKEKDIRLKTTDSICAILQFMDIQLAEESIACLATYLGVNSLCRLAEVCDESTNSTGHSRITYLHPGHVAGDSSNCQCSLDVKQHVSELIRKNQKFLDHEGYCIVT